MLDNRIVRVSIEYNGALRTYENLAITVSGRKYVSPNQGECNVTIANLSKEVRDEILTETSPFNRNRTRKSIIVEVGRESYGTSVLYRGDIFRSSVSQAPDNILTLRCLTAQFQKGNIITRTAPESERLSVLSQSIASDNGLDLNFLSQEKNIANYNFVGASINQVELLSQLSGEDVFVDGETLIVKPPRQPVPGTVRVLSPTTGMVGIPEFTEQGIKVTFLYDPQTVVGGEIQIDSIQYPATNGRYSVYKLEYNITNRDTPFYLTAEATRL